MLTKQYYGLPFRRLCAIVIFSAITPSVLLMAPAIASQLAIENGLGPAEIGRYFFIELAAMSLAVLPGFYWQTRVDWRKVALVSVALFLAANVASVFVASYQVLLVLRFLSALGGGTLMVLSLSSAATSSDPDRVYGFWLVGQLLLGAVGLYVMPLLFGAFGLKALYITLVVFVLLSVPFALSFEAGPPQARPSASIGGGAGAGRLRQGLGLVAIFTLYIGISSVWTFVGMVATKIGLDPATAGSILAAATLCGIPTAVLTTVLGQRWPRRVLILAGYAAATLAILMLTGLSGVVMFTAAALLFKMAWTFIVPYILASMAEIDGQGRLMGVVNLMIGAGLAFGPGFAGAALEKGVSLSGMLAGCAATVVGSYLMLALAIRPSSRTQFLGSSAPLAS